MKIHQQGQGFIEMMFVVLFIAVSVVAMVKFQNYLAYNSNLTQQRSDATILVTNRIEVLRDFDVLNTQGTYLAYQGIVSGSGNTTVGNTTYSIVWTVTANTTPTYKTLDVTASWTDRFNGSQSVRLVSNVAGIDPASSVTVM